MEGGAAPETELPPPPPSVVGAAAPESELPPPPPLPPPPSSPTPVPDAAAAVLPVWGSVRSSEVFERLDEVGAGQFGEVSRARDRDTGLVVALKRIRTENEKEGFPITAVREVLILSRLSHEHVVRLLEVVAEPGDARGSVFLVLEYCAHDLAGLADRPGVRFAPDQVKCLIQQTLRGTAFCHDRGARVCFV